jgi:hypothetical protein
LFRNGATTTLRMLVLVHTIEAELPSSWIARSTKSLPAV